MLQNLPSSFWVVFNVVAAEWNLRSNKEVLTREVPIEYLALANSSHPCEYYEIV